MAILWEPQLDDDSRRWRDLARDLTEKHFAPLAAELDREQRYPWESVKRLIDSRIAGMFVPKPYGGEGASLTALSTVIEEVARGCASTAAIVVAFPLGAFPILLEGTEEQKKTYLGGLAKEGVAVNFALSERGAGSDIAAIETTAVKDGANWRINGEKCWLGNGGAARFYIVFARTGPDRAATAFIVDKEQKGVAIDFFEDKMGLRGTLTSNLKLKDVVVLDSAIVGTEGKGLRLALRTLTVGRVTVAAQSTGLARGAYEAAARWAVKRKAFGSAIAEHQAVGFKLADMVTELSAARMMTFAAARAYDQGEDISSLGAMAKLFASEAAHRIANQAVQVHGGYGYVKPQDVERYYRDQRILEIYEGTSEILRMVLMRAVRNEFDTA
jgi:alkylation response protein AidB-like acyl-CoA dehydrogenase